MRKGFTKDRFLRRRTNNPYELMSVNGICMKCGKRTISKKLFVYQPIGFIKYCKCYN